MKFGLFLSINLNTIFKVFKIRFNNKNTNKYLLYRIQISKTLKWSVFLVLFFFFFENIRYFSEVIKYHQIFWDWVSYSLLHGNDSFNLNDNQFRVFFIPLTYLFSFSHSIIWIRKEFCFFLSQRSIYDESWDLFHTTKSMDCVLRYIAIKIIRRVSTCIES